MWGTSTARAPYHSIAETLAEAGDPMLPETGHARALLETAEKFIANQNSINSAFSTLSPEIATFQPLNTIMKQRKTALWVERAAIAGERFDSGALVSLNPETPDSNTMYLAFWLRESTRRHTNPPSLLFCPVLCLFDPAAIDMTSIPSPGFHPGTIWRRRQVANMSVLRRAMSPALTLRETDGTRKLLQMMQEEESDLSETLALFCEIALDTSLMALCYLAKFAQPT